MEDLANIANKLQDENDRLKALLRKATKAMTCCTILSIDKENHERPNFSDGVLYGIETVTKNIWRILEAPEGKPSYVWWERQIDPNVKFVDSSGNEIHHSTNNGNNET